MFYLRIADLNVALSKGGLYVRRIGASYATEPFDRPDISITVTPEAIEYERKFDTENSDEVFLKSAAVLRGIASAAPDFDAFLMHAAVVEVDGHGYAFLAPSGTGKSTHIRLWQQTLAQPVTVVNGDKPLLRRIDGRFRAFGTPWSGKEQWQTNTSVEMAGLCFLERGSENTVRKLTPTEAVMRLLRQVYLPPDLDRAGKVMELLDDLLTQVPAYELHCNMEPEAALVSYNAMCPKG